MIKRSLPFAVRDKTRNTYNCLTQGFSFLCSQISYLVSIMYKGLPHTPGPQSLVGTRTLYLRQRCSDSGTGLPCGRLKQREGTCRREREFQADSPPSTNPTQVSVSRP